MNNFFISDLGIHQRPHPENKPRDNLVEICEAWLMRYAKPAKDYDVFSYSLKHRIERDNDTYISNGALIQAAANLDYRIKPSLPLNCYFYMELLLPEDEWKRVRPVGFSKWLFEQQRMSYFAEDAAHDPVWPRRAKTFIEFWDYLSKYDYWVTDALVEMWHLWSGKLPAVPNNELCERFYYDSDEFDFIGYEEPYPKSDKGMTYIYALIDPRDFEVRYIGQTKNPTKRLKQHTLRPGSIEKVKWIGELLSVGIFPEMAIINLVENEEVNETEMALIYSFQQWETKPLLNRITPL